MLRDFALITDKTFTKHTPRCMGNMTGNTGTFGTQNFFGAGQESLRLKASLMVIALALQVRDAGSSPVLVTAVRLLRSPTF